MLTRRPSAKCLNTSVTLAKVAAWSQAAAGGRRFSVSPSQPIRCGVQPTTSTDVDAHGRETLVTTYQVYLADDYGLDVRDELIWGTTTLVVTGVRNAAGRSRTWVVDCEART